MLKILVIDTNTYWVKPEYFTTALNMYWHTHTHQMPLYCNVYGKRSTNHSRPLWGSRYNVLPTARHCLVDGVTLLSVSESGADKIQTWKTSHVSGALSLSLCFSISHSRARMHTNCDNANLCQVFCCLNDAWSKSCFVVFFFCNTKWYYIQVKWHRWKKMLQRHRWYRCSLHSVTHGSPLLIKKRQHYGQMEHGGQGTNKLLLSYYLSAARES